MKRFSYVISIGPSIGCSVVYTYAHSAVRGRTSTWSFNWNMRFMEKHFEFNCLKEFGNCGETMIWVALPSGTGVRYEASVEKCFRFGAKREWRELNGRLNKCICCRSMNWAGCRNVDVFLISWLKFHWVGSLYIWYILGGMKIVF